MALGKAVKEMFTGLDFGHLFGSGISRGVLKAGPDLLTTILWWGAVTISFALVVKHFRRIRSWISIDIAASNAIQRLWIAAFALTFAAGVLLAFLDFLNNDYENRYLTEFAACPELIGKKVPEEVRRYRKAEAGSMSPARVDYFDRCVSHTVVRMLVADRIGWDFSYEQLKSEVRRKQRTVWFEKVVLNSGLAFLTFAFSYAFTLLISWIIWGKRKTL